MFCEDMSCRRNLNCSLRVFFNPLCLKATCMKLFSIHLKNDVGFCWISKSNSTFSEALENRNQVNRKCVLQYKIDKVHKTFLKINRHFAQNCQLCKLLTLQKLHTLPKDVSDS